jgi:hypothetical protein
MSVSSIGVGEVVFDVLEGSLVGRPHSAQRFQSTRVLLGLRRSRVGTSAGRYGLLRSRCFAALLAPEVREVASPPIVELLKKKPWLVANLYSGRIPQREG